MKLKMLFFFLIYVNLNAQFKPLRIGFLFGKATQQRSPLNNKNYTYSNDFYKLSFHFLIKKYKNSQFEFIIEPSYYDSKHQLVNLHYIEPHEPDFENRRIRNLQLKSFNEYVLNLGLIYRYCLIKDASIYGIANIGPMYLPIETERQVKGLTFSDIFGIGLNYKINKFSLDFRGSIRHVSNAYIKTPNAGYNSIGLEVGVFYEL